MIVLMWWTGLSLLGCLAFLSVAAKRAPLFDLTVISHDETPSRIWAGAGLKDGEATAPLPSALRSCAARAA